MAGGRRPADSTVVSDCTAWSALPASSSFNAASISRCASAGSCFFFFSFASSPPSAFSACSALAGAFFFGAADAVVPSAHADATAAAVMDARASVRQSRAINPFLVTAPLLRNAPPVAEPTPIGCI
jgi:hypothetical protein